MFLLSQRQLCRIAGKPRFPQSWWSELIAVLGNATERERLVFFFYGTNPERTFVVTSHPNIIKWNHPEADAWNAALARLRLDEPE